MGFVNKHSERDSMLPMHRKNLMDRIEQDLLHDDHVLALFYGGSIGNENTDCYSDIDLRVVIKSEKIKEYISEKKIRPLTWGKVLYFEDANPLSNYTVAHYDSFVKVDTFYYKLDDLQPSVWLENSKIKKDTTGMIAEILGKSKTLTYETTLAEFELWRTKFFAYLHEAYRRTRRGEYYYALNCVDSMRLSMCTAWCMEAGVQPNAFGDWAKYEGARSGFEPWQKSLLEDWECVRDPVEIMNVMRSIVPAFRNVHESLCNNLGVEVDSEWVDEIINKVM
ncbi:hypothetical protein VBD025_16155 [Virgibacillus flavescens]|uniref:hypothetical protein n=1 Tax=Virgibacillus flavescens TaxID=1611422 RepID=UPI003D357C5E